MRLRNQTAVALVLSLAAGLLAVVTGGSSAHAASDPEFRALALVNASRAQASLPPLRLSAAMSDQLSRPWTANMAATGTLSHNPQVWTIMSAVTPGWTWGAENVGYGGNVDIVHGAFMNSSGHRANILSAQANWIGVGVVASGGRTWVTLNFARTAAALVEDTPVNWGPFGNPESFVPVPGGAVVAGWAIDPDATGPVPIQVWVDGVLRAYVMAADSRPDVGAAFPAYGSNHGFRVQIPMPPGRRSVCVAASNVGAGADAGLGCRTITVSGGSPFGNPEGVLPVSGGAVVSGWAIDPDTAAPVPVQVWVDGVLRAYLPAADNRPDVGGVFPVYGSNHGFRVQIPMSPGLRSICVAVNNTGAGADSGLGCRVVPV